MVAFTFMILIPVVCYLISPWQAVCILLTFLVIYPWLVHVTTTELKLPTVGYGNPYKCGYLSNNHFKINAFPVVDDLV